MWKTDAGTEKLIDNRKWWCPCRRFDFFLTLFSDNLILMVRTLFVFRILIVFVFAEIFFRGRNDGWQTSC